MSLKPPPALRGMGVSVCGFGHYLPEEKLTNDDLSALVDTNDSWIFPRTGIRSRHRAAANEATSDLACIAGARALTQAKISSDQLDLIIVATATPDSPVPPCATLVQFKLGARNAAAMDVSAACAGFLFATHTAAGLIRGGMHKRVLVLGAETLTRITDYSDRSTCILFGDAAGAAVLGPTDSLGAGDHLELLYTSVGTDGRHSGLIQVVAGGSRVPASEESVRAGEHYLRLKGNEVFRHAVTTMARAARVALDELGLTAADIRWLIPHQANARIMNAVGEQLGVPPERTVHDIAEVGNTSAASLPVAISRMHPRGEPAPGDLIMLLTFGAGLTWGCQVYQARKKS